MLTPSIDRWLATRPWTDVYGLGRSLLAGALLLTLLANPTGLLFRPAGGIPLTPHCGGAAGNGLFCQMPAQLELARWIAIAILAVAVSGWRPRWTALPQWYVTWSYFTSATVVDGGDQLAAILSLLLVPLALTDARAWHWSAPDTTRAIAPLASLSAWLATLAIRLQVAIVYFEAAVAKIRVDEWRDGTATYYYLLDPTFGAPTWLRPLAERVLTSAAGVTAITWGTIVLEAALFAGLVAEHRWRRVLLIAGIAFHAAIAVVAGLTSFGLVMTAACVLYLRPLDRPFALADAVAALRRRSAAPIATAAAPSPVVS